MINLFTWRVLAIACGIVFLGCLVVLIVFKFIKNDYYFEYKEDELIKESKSVNSKNYLYFTSNPTTYQYIRRYVLCKTISEKYCICNYAREFNKISFFVIQYDKKRKVIGVTKCVEIKNSEASKVIPLKRKTESVNVIVSKVDKMEINSSVIKPYNYIKVMVYSAIRALMTFTLLFSLRHILVELLGESYIGSYLNSKFDFYIILGMFIFSVVIGLICNFSLRKKNYQNNRGGVIEYEFI